MSILENPGHSHDTLEIAGDGQLSRRGFRVSFALNGVDFRTLQLDDPVPTGRQILKAAGKHHVDDHALFVITDDGDFEDVRPDEAVDLRGRAMLRFLAFDTDPLRRFTLNDSRIVWGGSSVPEVVLRSLSGIGTAEAVFLEVRGGTDQLVPVGGMADLTAAGVERFITAPHKVSYRFFVNGKAYETEKKKITGAEIKAIVPGWDESHDLALEGEGDDPDRIVADDEAVSLDPIHGTRRFSSVPKANFG